MTVAAFATLPLVWTVRGPRRCPSGPPSGPVDVAAGRLVRLVTVADPGLRLAALRRYGLGPTGLPPVGPNRLGVGRDEWNRTHEALTRVARGSGPPVPLLDALVLLEEHLPASPGRLALLMQQRRLTDRPLHPLAVVELGRLWWLPVPPARLVSRGPGGLDPSRAVVLTGTATEAGRAGLARRVRRAGAVPLTVATGVARASGLSADDPAAVDLLAHWRLYHQGSRVVWDHDGGGPLARAVQRTLAACGPLPARDLVVGLGRARFSRLGPVPPLTDPGLLLSWAREQPALRVRDIVVALDGHDAPAPALLGSRADRLLHALTADREPHPVRVLRDALVMAGIADNDNAAKTRVASAPYLEGVTRGRVALRRPG